MDSHFGDGQSGSPAGDGAKAFIWDAENGMRRIDEVLAALGEFVPAGWSLIEAVAITVPESGVLVMEDEHDWL